MATTTTTVNVNECCQAATPGSFSVRVFYTETDAGHLFGTFTTRERAEQALLVLAGRAGVLNATIEGA